jgi:hypothetical protein
MDYSSFFSQQYPNVTPQNFQASNNAFNPQHNNSNNSNNSNEQQRRQQSQSQQQNNNQISQLQQNMFYLDPFDTKVEQHSNDPDHTSYSSTISSPSKMVKLILMIRRK